VLRTQVGWNPPTPVITTQKRDAPRRAGEEKQREKRQGKVTGEEEQGRAEHLADDPARSRARRHRRNQRRPGVGLGRRVAKPVSEHIAPPRTASNTFRAEPTRQATKPN